MGMDVYGHKAKNKRGEYFRNNIWYWRPLWSYCLTNYPVVTKECGDNGFTNSGNGLNASDSKKLAKLIKRDIENGKAQLYADKYKLNKIDHTQYPFEVENLQEWQEFLDSCGGFSIY